MIFLHPSGVEKVRIYFSIEREKDHAKGVNMKILWLMTTLGDYCLLVWKEKRTF
jgi:hypothetical protein